MNQETDNETLTTERIGDMYAWSVHWRADDLADRPDLLQLREKNRADFERWLAAHELETRKAQREADAQIALSTQKVGLGADTQGNVWMGSHALYPTDGPTIARAIRLDGENQ